MAGSVLQTTVQTAGTETVMINQPCSVVVSSQQTNWMHDFADELRLNLTSSCSWSLTSVKRERSLFPDRYR